MDDINDLLSNGYVTSSGPSNHDGGDRIQYGDFDEFIREINLPRQIMVGQSIYDGGPTIVIERTTSVLNEAFKKPFFKITKKIRVSFIGDGIQVLGSNMEKPGCFVFDVPKKKVEYSWHLLVSCSPSCVPGWKPMIISIDTFRENLLLKGIAYLAKFLSVVALCAMTVTPFMYYLNNDLKSYIDRAIFGDPISSNLPIASLILLVIVVFSKRFDELFTSLIKDEDFMKTSYHAKLCQGKAILVKKT